LAGKKPKQKPSGLTIFLSIFLANAQYPSASWLNAMLEVKDPERSSLHSPAMNPAKQPVL